MFEDYLPQDVLDKVHKFLPFTNMDPESVLRVPNWQKAILY